MAVGRQLSDLNPDGTSLGQSVSDKVSLYGVTPITQRSGASQNTTLLTTASSTAIDTLTKAAIIEIMDTLRVLGVWKGSA
jgi:predicted transposase YdaD